MSKEVVEMFNKGSAKSYDEKNSHFSSISENLFFLTDIILSRLPEEAHILCVGVGTGKEIVDLARKHPKWKFTGVEPAESMLKGCREKLEAENLMDRCQLFHGYLTDYKSDNHYDGALCFFVLHFLTDLSERKSLIEDIKNRLHSRGIFVNSEICHDMNSPDFESISEDWLTMQSLPLNERMSREKWLTSMKEHLLILSPERSTALLEESGFSKAVCFFQSLLIRAWYSQKVD